VVKLLSEAIKVGNEERRDVKALLASINDNLERNNSKLEESHKISLKVANHIASKEKNSSTTQSNSNTKPLKIKHDETKEGKSNICYL